MKYTQQSHMTYLSCRVRHGRISESNREWGSSEFLAGGKSPYILSTALPTFPEMHRQFTSCKKRSKMHALECNSLLSAADAWRQRARIAVSYATK